MPDTFILDAYNLIRLLLAPRELERGLPESRYALEARLRAFRQAHGPGTRLFIVYDGELGRAAPARNEKGFEVYFSKPPKKADDVVLELAHRHEGEPGLQVVTSDFTDIARNLRGLRLRHITSAEFAALVGRRLARKGQKPQGHGPGEEAKPGSLTPGEVEEWTKAFGFGEDPEPPAK